MVRTSRVHKARERVFRTKTFRGPKLSDAKAEIKHAVYTKTRSYTACENRIAIQ